MGFVLDVCPKECTFEAREPAIEQLMREACEKCWRMTIVPTRRAGVALTIFAHTSATTSLSRFVSAL